MHFDFKNAKHIEKLSRRISTSYKKLRGSSHGDEDCVQEILLRFIEGKHRNSTIDQAVIDYLRLRTGRKGLPGFAERANLEYAIAHGSEKDASFDGRDPRGEPVARMDIWRMLKPCGDSTDRAAFILSRQWGMSEAEIGNIFGFSVSRASQRISRVQKCLSARIARQKRSELSGDGAGKMATILCAEAKRQLWGMGEITFERMEEGEPIRVESFNEKSF